MRALTDDLPQEALVREQGGRQLVTGHVLETGCFRDVKTRGAVRLPTHEDVEDEEAPAWVPTKPAVVKTHQMLSVIVQVHLAQSWSVEISLACRVQRREGHGKDPVLSGRLIDGGRSNRRCRETGKGALLAGNLFQDQIHLGRRDVEIRDHRVRVWRWQLGRRGWLILNLLNLIVHNRRKG